MDTGIPAKAPPFGGTISRLAADSTPSKSAIQLPPEGAPNVVVVMLDDVGFGAVHLRWARADAGFGPGRRRTALQPVPHHRALLPDPGGAAHRPQPPQRRTSAASPRSPYGFPGYDGVIPGQHGHGRRDAEAATATAPPGSARATSPRCGRSARPGRSTAGRPGWASSASTGSMGGEASQCEPALYRPDHADHAALGTKRTTTSPRTWPTRRSPGCAMQKAAAPGQAVLRLLRPGRHPQPRTTCRRTGSRRFKGQFDQGWDRLREETFQRQQELGVIPPGTQLTPRPEGDPGMGRLPPTLQTGLPRG